MKNKKTWLAIIIILLLGALAWVLFPLDGQIPKIPYSEFLKEVDGNKVEKVEIHQSNLVFTLKGNADKYITDNPLSPTLRETLLSSGIEVTDKDSAQDTVTFVFDMIFNVIFYGIIIGVVVYLITLPGRKFVIIKHEKTKFSDIAGLDNVIKETKQLVEQLKHPDKFTEQGIRQPNGILLIGPPGNGKTLLAKAIAGEAGLNFIPTKATDFQSSFMAIGPAKVKALFRRARSHTPCIVFIDEFDGIAEKRNYAGQGIDKENNRIITSLLNEMDGFDGHRKGVLVIGATNNATQLDPAAIRAGRFDRKYLVPNPDAAARWQLINLYLRGHALDSSLTQDRLVTLFNGMCAAMIETILNEALIVSNGDNRTTINASDIRQAIIRCTSGVDK